MVERVGAGRSGVLALLALLLLACPRAPDPPAPRLPTVEVVTVGRATLDEVVHAIGSIDAMSSVPLRAQVAGRIERLHFSEGERVESGDLLVTIDDAELREQIGAMEAALRSAEAHAEEMSATLARVETLHARGILPEQELDEARSAAAVARAEVERIQADLRALRERQAYTRVRAPFSGRLADSAVDPGDWVQAGEPLVTLVALDALEVNLWVSQREAPRVSTGQPVRVRTTARPDDVRLGEIVFVSPEIDASSRTLLVKAALEDDEPPLTPGLSASGSIVVGRHAGPVVPERALVGTREGVIVYVVHEGVARSRPIEIGLREPGRVLVTAGLEIGETVVEYGHQRISDGDRVEIVDRRPTALAHARRPP